MAAFCVCPVCGLGQFVVGVEGGCGRGQCVTVPAKGLSVSLDEFTEDGGLIRRWRTRLA